MLMLHGFEPSILSYGDRILLLLESESYGEHNLAWDLKGLAGRIITRDGRVEELEHGHGSRFCRRVGGAGTGRCRTHGPGFTALVHHKDLLLHYRLRAAVWAGIPSWGCQRAATRAVISFTPVVLQDGVDGVHHPYQLRSQRGWVG